MSHAVALLAIEENFIVFADAIGDVEIMNTLNPKLKDKIFDLISEATENPDYRIRILNRQILLAQIIEMFCSWKKDFDCLPSLIQVGAYNPRYLKFVRTDITGRKSEEI